LSKLQAHFSDTNVLEDYCRPGLLIRHQSEIDWSLPEARGSYGLNWKDPFSRISRELLPACTSN
jgi:hypothetical protein